MRPVPFSYEKKKGIMEKTVLGRQGEILARLFLEKRGQRYRESNYRRRGGEIDIVMEDGESIVFVEVKTRYSRRYGEPAEAITAVKQKHIRYCAVLYIAEHGLHARPVRFDVVEVMMKHGEKPRIHHIRDAF